MFTYSYKYCDHIDYLHGLAKFAQVPVINNIIQLPETMGTGYIKAIELANGLQILINECTLNEDVAFTREAGTNESYTLRFDEVKNMKNLMVKIEEDSFSDEERTYSGAFLTNSLLNFSYTATAGTEDRCINIYFTADWLKKHVGISGSDEVFKKYLSLKTATLFFEVLNYEYRELMEDIFDIREGHPMQKVMLQNRIMVLIEKFFRSIYNKISATTSKKNITEIPTDITLRRMMQVESILTNNLAVPPPTIPEFARIAMMSETKLKNIFKAVYGLSIYEYYQKNRMLRARQLLRLKKYSVKEIGVALGFKNLSNFTIAYKKEFQVLPSEI